jgi:orotate phosphoribosyltransferase
LREGAGRDKKDMEDFEEILNLFRQKGALLEGHFLLSSGLHSANYLQCALVLQQPDIATEVCFKLASQFRSEKVDFVIAPALGGIIVAHEVAKGLGVRALFAERVLVVEDVVTTGGSTKETMRVVTEAGGVVAAVGSLIDRSGGTIDMGVPCKSLITLTIDAFQPKECPMCKKGIPFVKPGSRNIGK